MKVGSGRWAQSNNVHSEGRLETQENEATDISEIKAVMRLGLLVPGRIMMLNPLLAK